MARSARKYEIFLPLTYNDGRPIEDEKFNTLEGRLVDRFGGLTSQQHDSPLQGIWRGQSRVFKDEIALVTVLDFRRRGSDQYLARLKAQLLSSFDQEEILILETAVRIH
jgi:hypothetical protein